MEQGVDGGVSQDRKTKATNVLFRDPGLATGSGFRLLELVVAMR